MSEVDIIEEAVTDVAGSISRFVVEKQIDMMGEKREEFPPERLNELIESVLDATIFDGDVRRRVRRNIRKRIRAT